MSKTDTINQDLRKTYYPHAFGTPYDKMMENASQLETELSASTAALAAAETALRTIAHGEYDNAHDCMFAARIARAYFAQQP